jgi:predicted unusual protein kinase regulating ubiquinone biosynthesis (AarF/ABC1/UbiB family)
VPRDPNPKTLPKALKGLATSWLSRTARGSGTAMGVAARWTGGSLQKLVSSQAAGGALEAATQAAIAKRLATSLGQMKGLAMKLGQIASYLDFAMPEAARQVLAGLQDSTPPMAPDIIERVVREELGKGPREVFAEWSDAPVAAASIGQVHRARLPDGTEVAVKVQYPGVARSLDADLKSAYALDSLGSLLFRGQERGAVLAELRDRLMEECDYRHEAASQEEFRRLFADRSDIVIPEVYPAFSAARVLTTRFIDGRRFADFAAHAPQEERDRAGEAIWNFAMRSIFQHGLFNADPHPGNYLFLPGQVVFLDFGCVKRFTPEFVARWRQLCLACTRGDRPTFDRCVTEFGFAPDPKTYDFDYHFKMTRAIYEPWLEDKPYLFTQAFVERTWKALVVDNPNKFKLNLPRDFLFVNRVQWGLYAVLAQLGSVSNWRRRLLPYVDGDVTRPSIDRVGG